MTINSYMLFAFQKHTTVNLQSHSMLRKQFHLMDSFTKCLSGANFVGWSSTNATVGLNSILCLKGQQHSVSGFTWRSYLVSLKKVLMLEPCNICRMWSQDTWMFTSNTARELQPKEKKYPPSVKGQQVTIPAEE